MQTPPDVHSRAAAARMQHLGEVDRGPTVWHWVAAAGWVLAAAFNAYAKHAGEQSTSFVVGSAIGTLIISLILALILQAIGRLFYRQPPFRGVFPPGLFA